MDEFDREFKKIKKNEVKNFLTNFKSFCYETDLWKIAYPGANINRTEPLALYRNHFLLFFLLYNLQDDFLKENKYLHIHFMRVILLDYPENNECGFFDEHTLSFCKDITLNGKTYCKFHSEKTGGWQLEELSAKYFYLDKRNYFQLSEETARAFIKGSWELLSHTRKYVEALKVFDLPRSSDLSIIKRKFKQLAKKYHPDKSSDFHDKFVEINNAYHLLLRVQALFQKNRFN